MSTNPSTEKKLHPLQVEYRWFQAHREELLKQYRNRFLAIAGQQILGDYSNLADAYRFTARTHEPGTFLIHKCVPESEERRIRIRGRKIITFEDLNNEGY